MATTGTGISPSGLSALGSLSGAISGAGNAYASTNYRKADAFLREGTANANAVLAAWAATDAVRRGRIDELAVSRNANQAKGAVRASAAGRGVDVRSQSVLSLLTEIAGVEEIDKDTVRLNTAREEWSIQQQASQFGNEASVARLQQKASNPFASATGSLLGNAGHVAAGWYRWNQSAQTSSGSSWTGGYDLPGGGG